MSNHSGERMFFVAMFIGSSEAARATCVDEQANAMGRKLVREFYREYTGHEIRHVNGAEMKRLMSAPYAKAPPVTQDGEA